jgi:salicylate hydroxylase
MGKATVTIVGAGIGGLTTALALLQRGYKVSVFEKVPRLAEIGAGFHCTPNGVRVLHALGLKAAMESVAVPLEDRDIRLWSTGQAWRIPGHGAESAARYGAPYLLFHRGDLHAILLDAVRAIDRDCVQANAGCVNVTQSSKGTVAELHDGRRHESDALIGADGVHSVVRQCLFGQDRPVFTGEVAWRGLIPTAELPERMHGRITSNWIGPRGSVTVYPVRRGELMNFVGLVARDDWRVESWTEQGSIDECLRDFAGWHEDVHLLIGRIETAFKWALFLREPMAAWTRGRITLLGDACHPMTPYLGQGANMAIEDAFVLARCLDADDDVSAALRRYERARIARDNDMVVKSSEQSKRIHDDTLADPAAAVRYVETNWDPARIRNRYDWIFEYDATAVPV